MDDWFCPSRTIMSLLLLQAKFGHDGRKIAKITAFRYVDLFSQWQYSLPTKLTFNTEMEHYRFVLACPSIGLPFSRRPFLCSVSVFFHSPPTSVLFNFFIPPSFYISFLVCTSSYPFLCLAFFLPHVPFILFLFHPGLFLSLFSRLTSSYFCSHSALSSFGSFFFLFLSPTHFFHVFNHFFLCKGAQGGVGMVWHTVGLAASGSALL